MKSAILMSGGIDSICAWFFLGKRPNPIYINLQTKYSEKELLCLKKIKKIVPDFNYEVVEGINLGQFEVGDKAYIQHRNLILISLASNFANKIWLIGIEDDNVPDKSEKAFAAMEHCLNYIDKEDYRISVSSPFWEKSKSDIVKWFVKNIPQGEKILRTSVSCYSDKPGQCGKCAACLRKGISFQASKLKLDFFKNDVRKSPLIPEYLKAMKDLDNNYSEKRRRETLKVFKKWGYDIS